MKYPEVQSHFPCSLPLSGNSDGLCRSMHPILDTRLIPGSRHGETWGPSLFWQGTTGRSLCQPGSRAILSTLGHSCVQCRLSGATAPTTKAPAPLRRVLFYVTTSADTFRLCTLGSFSSSTVSIIIFFFLSPGHWLYSRCGMMCRQGGRVSLPATGSLAGYLPRPVAK